MENHSTCVDRALADWHHSNQEGIYKCLIAAYALTDEFFSPKKHPAFGGFNRNHLAGVGRWLFVDYSLQFGCETGMIRDVQPVWIPLSESENGVHALELRGHHTTLLAHHLPTATTAPRESTLRKDNRVRNEQMPFLPFFQQPEEPTDTTKLHLTLVHGHQTARFAYIRAYDAGEDASSFIPLTENLVNKFAADFLPQDDEEIQDVKVELKKSIVARSQA